MARRAVTLPTDVRPEPPPGLDDLVLCTVDSCDEDTDSILHAPDDSACDDSNDCTADSCDPVGDCQHDDDPTACPCVPTGACSPFEAGNCPGQGLPSNG